MSYLILHKVRGQPAFDVGEPMEVNGETWWIIPTSGHRAYPVMKWPLKNLEWRSEFGTSFPIQREIGSIESRAEFISAPDHYSVNDTPTHRERLSLEDLGL